MKYEVKSFHVLQLDHGIPVADEDIADKINAELGRRGLDALNLLSIVYQHQAVIVYYKQEATENNDDPSNVKAKYLSGLDYVSG